MGHRVTRVGSLSENQDEHMSGKVKRRTSDDAVVRGRPVRGALSIHRRDLGFLILEFHALCDLGDVLGDGVGVGVVHAGCSCAGARRFTILVG